MATDGQGAILLANYISKHVILQYKHCKGCSSVAVLLLIPRDWIILLDYLTLLTCKLLAFPHLKYSATYR